MILDIDVLFLIVVQCHGARYMICSIHAFIFFIATVKGFAMQFIILPVSF